MTDDLELDGDPGAQASRLVIRSVEFEKSGTRRDHFPSDPPYPQVAFVGRSNVGKSSLLNLLVNRKQLARVSNTPGRTQLVNFFVVNQALRLVDLPGYGFARAPEQVKSTWDRMITSYLKNNPQLKLVMALFDIRRQPSDEDLVLLDWLNHYQIPFAAVLTKADKLPFSQQVRAAQQWEIWLASYDPVAITLTSTLKRKGREDILDLLGEVVKLQG